MKVINPINTDKLTDGEKYTLDQKLKKIFAESECFIYVQPLINGLKPDFIIISKEFGVIIIEVKDWSDNYIENVNPQIVICDGKTYKNPNTQIKTYENIISSKLNGVVDFIDNQGLLKIPVTPMIFYVNLSQEITNEFTNLISNEVKSFNKKELRSLTIDTLIDNKNLTLGNKDLSAIRGVLFPEISIPSMQIIDPDECIKVNDIRVLDKEQEEFSKKVPNGHYMVSGIPGSGKTVMLLTRAIHLAQSNDNFSVLILTYTKALSNKLKNQLKSKAIEMQVPIGISNRIEIKNFHKLCYDLVGSPTQPKERKNENFYNEFWPKEAIKAIKNNPIYNAVLVDEYQDFHTDWFTLCKEICKKENGNENLFFAGDRLQRIYDVAWSSYKEIGINIQGRSKLLKTPYRTNPNHMDFALKFLSLDENLIKDISRFYEIEKINSFSKIENNIDTLYGNIARVSNYIRYLNINLDIPQEDILILCHSKYESENIINSLPLEIRSKFITGKDPVDNKGLITTYHSSKGLEAKYCILTKIERFENNKKNRTLMYVGMTRASKRLILHYETTNDFSEEISNMLNIRDIESMEYS